MKALRTVKVFLGRGGWWARIEKLGSFMDRGPYPFRWMAEMAFPIQRFTWCLALAVFAGALLFGHHTHAADVYPTVKEIESGLGYSPGALLKQAPINGHGWSFYYVRTRALGNGEYEVRIRLR